MSQENHNRNCPRCGESVRSLATHCRFCQHDLTVTVRIVAQDHKHSAKEIHKLALQLMKFKPGTFTYLELKQILTNPTTPLRTKITYAHALELSEFSKGLQLELSITESTQPLTIPVGTDAPASMTSQLVPQKSKFRLSTLQIILIITSIAAEGLYLSKKFIFDKPQSNPLTSKTIPNAQPQKQSLLPKNDEPSPSLSPAAGNSIQDKLVHATVTISDGQSVGSGFFINSQGYLITNVHVVEKMSKPVVYMEGGATFQPTVLRMEKNLDIALLKVSGVGRFPYLILGDASNINRGETIWTIGAPMGLTFSLTKGIVSYVGRNINGVAYLQTDAAINGGNSGGPMINEKGEVIGINTFIIRDSEGLGFSLPINYLTMGPRPILEGITDILETNNTMRTWLAYADENNSRKASFSDNRSPSPDSSRKSTPYINTLLKESQKMDSEYEQLKQKLTQEINSLNLTRQNLENQYQSDKVKSLSITAETTLGQNLKRMGSDIINRQIYLLEKTDTYYQRKQRKLSEILSFAEETSIKNQVQKALIDIKYLLDKNQETLLNKRVELKNLKAQTY